VWGMAGLNISLGPFIAIMMYGILIGAATMQVRPFLLPSLPSALYLQYLRYPDDVTSPPLVYCRWFSLPPGWGCWGL
jgi:hypothetical protein